MNIFPIRFGNLIMAGLILPSCFLGIVACQEEPSTTGETPATHSPTTTASPTTTTGMTPTQSSPLAETPFKLIGTVVKIDGSIYTIKDSNDENFSIEPTASVLVDKSLEVGDRVEVQYSKTDQPIAVRKVRGDEHSNTDSNQLTEERLVKGTLNRIDHEKGIFALTSTTNEIREFGADTTKALIDESLEVGDQVEVSLSENDHPIAIRKVRP